MTTEKHTVLGYEHKVNSYKWIKGQVMAKVSDLGIKIYHRNK